MINTTNDQYPALDRITRITTAIERLESVLYASRCAPNWATRSKTPAARRPRTTSGSLADAAGTRVQIRGTHWSTVAPPGHAWPENAGL
jgi:hypothetical protein